MTDKKKESSLGEVVGAVVEEGVTSVAVIGGTLVAGPGGGAVAGVLTKGAAAFVKRVFRKRAEQRTDDYSRELEAMIANPARLEALEEDEHFTEVVFQTYRKAMDALCSAVVPSLARLAAHFKDQPLDPFFRGLGRTLQDIEDEDTFHDLRRILSMIVRVGKDEVDVTMHTDEVRGRHCRFAVDTRGGPQPSRVFGILAEPRIHQLLALLDRNGLTREHRGVDLALSGRWSFDVALCRRALDIVERVVEEPFETEPIRQTF